MEGERRPGTGRTALITGASGGIGLDLAELMAADGFDLALLARSKVKLEELAAKLSGAHGVSARVLPKDLARPEAPAEVAAELAADGVAIDVLVNNAGFGVHGAFVESDLAEELALLQVNVVAVTHLTKLFLPPMVKRGWGRVMQVASLAALVPGPYLSCYYASKAYVLSHSLALARELRGTGVTVTALCPGPTATGFQARAGMERAELFRMRVMDSMTVARAGYQGMMRGRKVVVPGAGNKLSAFMTRLAPRGVVANVVANMNRDRR